MGSFPAKTKSLDDIYVSLGLGELSSEKISNLGAPKVVSLLAIILEKMIKKNEKSLQSSRKKSSSILSITCFHGLRAPSLSVVEYIERISKYSKCSPSCFVIAFIYIDRYIGCKNAFLTSLNVHRLLITSVTLAAKFIDEACHSNAHYAKIGGVSTKEINNLEREFLFSLDFSLHVTLETFDHYCLELKRCCKIEQSTQICGRNKRCDIKDDSGCTSKFAAYTCRVAEPSS